MSSPPLVEVNMDNSNPSPRVYTIPSPSYPITSPPPNSFYSKDPWPVSHQSGVCFDPSHYNATPCHTHLPPDTPYVIRTMPCDVECPQDHVQQRRRQAGIIICGCFLLSLPVIIFFVVMSIVLTNM